MIKYDPKHYDKAFQAQAREWWSSLSINEMKALERKHGISGMATPQEIAAINDTEQHIATWKHGTVPLDRQEPSRPFFGSRFTWIPEPRIACFVADGDGLVLSDAVENPLAKPLLVADISLHKFNCHAAYYAGGDWNVWDTLMLSDIADIIYLVSDEPGKIYCVASWKGLMVLFGRLDPLHNVVWDRCNEAFNQVIKYKYG